MVTWFFISCDESLYFDQAYIHISIGNSEARKHTFEFLIHTSMLQLGPPISKAKLKRRREKQHHNSTCAFFLYFNAI